MPEEASPTYAETPLEDVLAEAESRGYTAEATAGVVRRWQGGVLGEVAETATSDGYRNGRAALEQQVAGALEGLRQRHVMETVGRLLPDPAAQQSWAQRLKARAEGAADVPWGEADEAVNAEIGQAWQRPAWQPRMKLPDHAIIIGGQQVGNAFLDMGAEGEPSVVTVEGSNGTRSLRMDTPTAADYEAEMAKAQQRAKEAADAWSGALVGNPESAMLGEPGGGAPMIDYATILEQQMKAAEERVARLKSLGTAALLQDRVVERLKAEPVADEALGLERGVLANAANMALAVPQGAATATALTAKGLTDLATTVPGVGGSRPVQYLNEKAGALVNRQREGSPVNPLQAETLGVELADFGGQVLPLVASTGLATATAARMGMLPAATARLSQGVAGANMAGLGASIGAEMADTYGHKDGLQRTAMILGGAAVMPAIEALAGGHQVARALAGMGSRGLALEAGLSGAKLAGIGAANDTLPHLVGRADGNTAPLPDPLDVDKRVHEALLGGLMGGLTHGAQRAGEALRARAPKQRGALEVAMERADAEEQGNPFDLEQDLVPVEELYRIAAVEPDAGHVEALLAEEATPAPTRVVSKPGARAEVRTPDGLPVPPEHTPESWAEAQQRYASEKARYAETAARVWGEEEVSTSVTEAAPAEPGSLPASGEAARIGAEAIAPPADGGSTPPAGASIEPPARDGANVSQQTPDEFAAAAQFGKLGGKGNVVIQVGSEIHMVSEQKRGRLTADPQQILRRLHESQITQRFDAYWSDRADAAPGSVAATSKMAARRLENPAQHYGVSAEAVDKYGIQIPDGWVKSGELYVPPSERDQSPGVGKMESDPADNVALAAGAARNREVLAEAKGRLTGEVPPAPAGKIFERGREEPAAPDSLPYRMVEGVEILPDGSSRPVMVRQGKTALEMANEQAANENAHLPTREQVIDRLIQEGARLDYEVKRGARVSAAEGGGYGPSTKVPVLRLADGRFFPLSEKEAALTGKIFERGQVSNDAQARDILEGPTPAVGAIDADLTPSAYVAGNAAVAMRLPKIEGENGFTGWHIQELAPKDGSAGIEGAILVSSDGRMTKTFRAEGNHGYAGLRAKIKAQTWAEENPIPVQREQAAGGQLISAPLFGNNDPAGRAAGAARAEAKARLTGEVPPATEESSVAAPTVKESLTVAPELPDPVQLLRIQNAGLPEAARKVWTPEVYEKAGRYLETGEAKHLAGLTQIQRRRIEAVRMELNPELAAADAAREKQVRADERADARHNRATTGSPDKRGMAAPVPAEMEAVLRAVGDKPSHEADALARYKAAVPPTQAMKWGRLLAEAKAQGLLVKKAGKWQRATPGTPAGVVPAPRPAESLSPAPATATASDIATVRLAMRAVEGRQRSAGMVPVWDIAREAGLPLERTQAALREMHGKGSIFLSMHDRANEMLPHEREAVVQGAGVAGGGAYATFMPEVRGMASGATPPAVTGPLPTQAAHAASGLLPGVTWDGRRDTLHGLRRMLLNSVGLPSAGVGRMGRLLGGYFKKAEAVRLADINDIPVLSHEVGHHIHERILTDPGQPTNDFAGRFDAELLGLGAATSTKGMAHGDIIAEGVAEFTRLWLTNPVRARAAAPSFALHFETEIMAKRPEMMKALSHAQGRLQNYIAMPSWEKGMAHIVHTGEEGTPPRDSRQLLADQYTGWVNEIQPAKWALERIAKLDPSLRPEAERVAEEIENHQGGWQSKATGDLHFHQTDLHGKRVGDSLEKILSRLKPEQVRNLENYMVQCRAREVEAMGKRSGFEHTRPTDAEMAYWAKQFEPIRQQILKFQDNALQLLVDAGIVSKKLAAELRQMNRDYVPLYRFYEKLNGVSFGEGPRGSDGYVDLSSPLRRLKGDSRAIRSPLESIAKNVMMFRKLAEQNHIADGFFTVLEKLQGHGRMAQAVEAKLKATTINHKTVVQHLIDTGVIADASALPQSADLTLTLWTLMNQADAKNGEVTFFRDGKMQHREMKDASLRRALKSADMETLKVSSWAGYVFSKAIRLPAKALRVGATGGPWFALFNFARDQITAAVTSRNGWFIPFYHGLKGAVEVARGGDMFARFVEAGGDFSGLHTSPEAMKDMLEKVLPKDVRVRAQVARMMKPKNVLAALGYAGMLLERGTRVGEFGRQVGRGATDRAAANAAQSITLKFSRGGQYGRAVNQLSAFFNASIQDVDMFARRQFSRETAAEFTLKALTWVTAPSVTTWLLGKDDPMIQALPEWRKVLFWNVRLGDYVLSVPKPFLVGQLYGTAVEKGLDAATGRDPNAMGKAARAIRGSMIDPVAVSNQLMGLRPITEALLNKQYFGGREVVPEWMTDLPPSMQYDGDTSQTAKLLGRSMGVSPMLVDHMVSGYFATGGKWAVDGLDWAMAKMGVTEPAPAPEEDASQLPLVNRFFGGKNHPYAANEYVSRYYKAAGDMDALMKFWSRGPERLSTSEHKQWWDKHGAELQYWQRAVPGTTRSNATEVRRMTRRLGEISGAMREVWDSRSLSPAEKRTKLLELSKQRNTLAEEGFKQLFPAEVRKRHY